MVGRSTLRRIALLYLVSRTWQSGYLATHLRIPHAAGRVQHAATRLISDPEGFYLVPGTSQPKPSLIKITRRPRISHHQKYVPKKRTYYINVIASIDATRFVCAGRAARGMGRAGDFHSPRAFSRRSTTCLDSAFASRCFALPLSIFLGGVDFKATIANGLHTRQFLPPT